MRGRAELAAARGGAARQDRERQEHRGDETTHGPPSIALDRGSRPRQAGADGRLRVHLEKTRRSRPAGPPRSEPAAGHVPRRDHLLRAQLERLRRTRRPRRRRRSRPASSWGPRRAPSGSSPTRRRCSRHRRRNSVYGGRPWPIGARPGRPAEHRVVERERPVDAARVQLGPAERVWPPPSRSRPSRVACQAEMNAPDGSWKTAIRPWSPTSNGATTTVPPAAVTALARGRRRRPCRCRGSRPSARWGPSSGRSPRRPCRRSSPWRSRRTADRD